MFNWQGLNWQGVKDDIHVCVKWNQRFFCKGQGKKSLSNDTIQKFFSCVVLRIPYLFAEDKKERNLSEKKNFWEFYWLGWMNFFS